MMYILHFLLFPLLTSLSLLLSIIVFHHNIPATLLPLTICGALERSPEWQKHPYWADEGYSRCIDCRYEEEDCVYSRVKNKFVQWNEFYVYDVLGALDFLLLPLQLSD